MVDTQSLRLVEIIQQLSFCQNLEQIIDVVRSAAREVVSADGATFVLREDHLCHYVDEDAISPLFKGNHFPMEMCISGTAMIEGRTIVVPDIYEDARIPIEVYRPTFVKSLCMTPIRADAAIGAIGVYWKEKHVATLEEARVLSVLANSCSTAMQNVYLQTQLKARLEQVQRLSRLKDEFLRNLSHELRTPLNQIMGWVQLLSEDCTEDELREGLSAVKSCGKRQDAVIKDLLDCSQLVSGEMEFSAENFDLGELIPEVLQIHGLAIINKKLETKVLSDSTHSLVNADRHRCREILSHLVSNAVKFSTPGGEIRLRCYREDGQSIIEVGDDGIGIHAQFLGQVFDLFAQADSGITRTYSGTGLGLSISRYLAEAQGGQVSISSQGLGHGVLATFELPTAAIRFTKKRSEDPAYMANVLGHLMHAEAKY